MFKLFATLFVLISTSALVSAGPCDSLPMFCTPSQTIECARSIDFGDTYYKEAIDDIIKSVEPYVFRDILKNPPQPEGFTDYFKPLDLIAELKKVKTENTNFYDFYRETQGVLMRAQDGHFSFLFTGNEEYNNKLTSFFISPPILLSTDTDDQGNPIMVGAPVPKVLDIFDPYVQSTEALRIKGIIENNTGVPIDSINGKNPFEYVFNLGSKYFNFLKSKDAKYTYVSNNLAAGAIPLYFLPLDALDFTDFTVTYKNGETFSSDYFIFNLNALYSRKRRNADGKSFSEVARELIKNNPLGKPIKIDDVVKTFESGKAIKKPLSDKEIYEQLKNVDFKQIRANKAAREPTGIWDFATKDGIFKCKVDDTNNLNVYFINSFSMSNETEFWEVFGECVYAFENNTYPIIVITDSNPGGSILLSSIFQEAVQPDMVSRGFFSYMTENATKNAFKTLLADGIYADPETCATVGSVEELMEGAKTEDYGNGVTHTHTKPLFVVYNQVRATLDKLKPMFVNRRKPTEIIVFTDSFSFSASSILTKGLREAGGAIMVGYNGYPGSPAETFDIGQSPTQVMSNNLVPLFNPTEYERLSAKGITYALMSFGESFRPDDVYSKKTPLVPREFLFDAADERVPFYSSYVDEAYDNLVAVSKGIFSKYETYCNPNNPKLHMRDASCDAIINKAHMHGGFTCGADGKWSTTCEGYYCDDGYYFDSHTKTCVKDPCYTLATPSSSSSSSSSSIESATTSTSSVIESGFEESKESKSHSESKSESDSKGSFSSSLAVSTFILFFIAFLML